ncbi:hypothetical protein DEI92_00980 [Curtobacterium sp. MCBD17_034]|uniref:hypothetical protein n=1 Tax=unclassified Curtobacterium TaxID=257496 RepID=UPI000DAA1C1F|nr:MULTISPECIES: hypothetical protein [unclassified Curtobacterium]PZF62118.1 hypothetical protein DEI92_00980 [Curtobacterium sp. MCBD17_034]PZM33947.1 hypothetical protein DEI90_09720 [Curtobacterium sp. MCBD17_031]
MNILDEIHAAYGGDRWREAFTISARKRFGGVTWPVKRVDGLLDAGSVSVTVHDEQVRFWPVGTSSDSIEFTPERVRVVGRNGGLVEELVEPRRSFAGHVLETPWSTAQLGYFAGYAMWTYLAEPVALRVPGTIVEEGGQWHEDGESWRVLHVTYPAGVATHSAQQTLYIDADGLIRRRDYTVDVLGGATGAHYVRRHEVVDGLVIGTDRVVYSRDEHGAVQKEPTLVSIALSDVVVS